MTHQPVERQCAAIRQCIAAYRDGQRPLPEVMEDLELLLDQLPDTSWRADVVASWASVGNGYRAAVECLTGAADPAEVRRAVDEVLLRLERLDAAVADRAS